MATLKPVVSVILPIRQWRKHTLKAVHSILAQTLDALELIIVGPTHCDVIPARLPQDPRITLLKRNKPGIVNALNLGLQHANGEYIARMDDDDFAYPERLETQLAYLKDHPSIQLCGSKIRFVDANDQPSTIKGGNQAYQQWLNSLCKPSPIKTQCYVENPMPHPTLFAHRSVWGKLNGYREFDGPEDYDLVLRAMLLRFAMGKPQDILQDWREHKDRLTYNDSRYRRQAFTLCRAQTAADTASGLGLADGRGVWLCGTGRLARDWHDALTDLQVPVQGFVDIKGCQQKTRKRNKLVITYDELPQRRGTHLVISAVSQYHAKQQLADYFDQQHWTVEKDYIFGG